MADDAGALLVRSGLVPPTALDEARVKVASLGGTLGEQLVAAGTISDDALTEFYRQRLLVPQVNPNTLARLPVRVVSAIPSDMAIELRAIPVSLDTENNLTVAMSDPSDSHAVDEIAFFTGTYVVRAVATQMQIAWCLAHYYGHVTALGQKLLQPQSDDTPPSPPPVGVPPGVPIDAPSPIPRTKGHTSKINAARHRAIVPVTGPVPIQRPDSAVLDDPSVPEAQVIEVRDSEPEIKVEGGEGVPGKPRARSISGEIRVPIRRAPSIKPPMPDPHEDIPDDEDEAPVITIEAAAPEPAPTPDEDPTGPRKVPVRKRKAKTDPPELAARGGEINLATGPITKVDLDEPRIIINDESPTGADVSGEMQSRAHRDHAAPATTIEVDDTSVGVVIHEHYKAESEPVLLDRRLGTDDGPTGETAAAPPGDGDDDDEVVVLDAVKNRIRPDKKTQVGMVATPISPRAARDTEAGMPLIDDAPTGEIDATRVDTMTAPRDPGDYSDEIAPPPQAQTARSHTETNSPVSPLLAARTTMMGHRAPPPPDQHRWPARSDLPLAPRPHSITKGEEDDDDPPHTWTTVMTAVELDEAVPDRASGKVDYDPVDDGWGPPGTTIPPPLLGAMPGTEAHHSAQIPVPDMDFAPLMVAPPSPPEPARGSPAIPDAPSLVRALEEATSRSVQLIHMLERSQSRDEVIALMMTHLAQTHRRAGFFSIKNGELAVFSMTPKADIVQLATLRLDKPSTLQDVVGTRLPYRGPMHDDDSRQFLAGALGTAPAEILLVPVTVRERVVGVLFGEQRVLHTFDDQLALAARAAGMALERILKTKRT